MSTQQSHREGRIIHDADSHIIEYPGWLESYSSEYVKANLKPSKLTMTIQYLSELSIRPINVWQAMIRS